MTHVLDELKDIDLSFLSKEEAKDFTVLLEELDNRERRDASSASFLDFVKNIWAEFIG